MYEASDKEMGSVDAGGHVSVLRQPGSFSVMVRYQGKVATFQATLPLGAPVERLPFEQDAQARGGYPRRWPVRLLDPREQPLDPVGAHAGESHDTYVHLEPPPGRCAQHTPAPHRRRPILGA